MKSAVHAKNDEKARQLFAQSRNLEKRVVTLNAVVDEIESSLLLLKYNGYIEYAVDLVSQLHPVDNAALIRLLEEDARERQLLIE